MGCRGGAGGWQARSGLGDKLCGVHADAQRMLQELQPTLAVVVRRSRAYPTPFS